MPALPNGARYKVGAERSKFFPVTSEQDLLDMSYDLLKYRGFKVTSETDSMELLYFYGKYKKDREKAAQQTGQPRVTKAY